MSVKVSERGPDVAVVAIARPERRNALDAATAAGVADAVEQAGNRHRVVLLTGEGGAFCAGGDLDELQRWTARDAGEIARTLYDSFQRMIRVVRAVPAVVIAVLPGAAVGAGLDLALACDLRVAAQGAKLGQVWVRLGLIPGTGGAYLTQALVGPGRAAELLLTGRLVDAEEALRLGLVNRVVPGDALLEEADALAREILAHPPEGVIANKRAMVAATEGLLTQALEHAAQVQAERFVSEEFKQALARARAR